MFYVAFRTFVGAVLTVVVGFGILFACVGFQLYVLPALKRLL